ncbi:hypothetical protein ON010_g10654 [Phytophthora cinnamomi]|nr:hypothetical protein ON010_g10654 [Phytophthora cinnamomi]
MPPRSWKVGNLRRTGTQTSVMEMLLSPASDATLRLMTSPPPAQSATVSAAGGGEDPAREEAPAETKRSPPVFSACVPQATKKQTKRGRPAKADPELWTKEATETLFAVLYVTAKDEFTRARNHVEVGAAWVMVTMLVNKAEEKAYTVLQCKDEAAPPPCLDLMLEHWDPNPGMQNTSLCDVSTTHDADDETGDASSNEDEAPAAPRNKRKKTNGECVEEGMHVHVPRSSRNVGAASSFIPSNYELVLMLMVNECA